MSARLEHQPPRQLGKTHAEITSGKSSLSSYQRVIVGRQSIGSLLYFEFCRWVGAVPGAAGLALRKLFWPRLFGSCGKGVVFGGSVTLLHPHRIHIGARTVISDNCVLDARTSETDRAIRLGEDSMLSHGVMISTKNGRIEIGDRCGIGAYTVISSVGQRNRLKIGDDVVIGPRCYVTGSGNYNMDRLDIPISRQGTRDMGGSRVGHGVWLGASVCVQGGVSVGDDAVIGSGAVVTKDVPGLAICAGVPAKVIRYRDKEKSTDLE